VAKDKYTDLAGQPGVRVRVERLSGNATRRDVEIWWDQELIAFMATASPVVKTIVEAEGRILDAARAVNIEVDDVNKVRAEVVMFHGTFVKVEIWCPPGTAKRLGIKGYGK
jgi:hypothetical protein